MVIRGCRFPDELYYDVRRHVWYREESGGRVVVGITAAGAALAGDIVAFTPKRPGRTVESGHSCGIVESGKIVSPVYIACDATVVAINENLMENPRLINRDPYGAGWMVALKPADWAKAREALTGASGLVAAYEKQMDADKFVGCFG